jgi:hypothetical protein
MPGNKENFGMSDSNFSFMRSGSYDAHCFVKKELNQQTDQVNFKLTHHCFI